MVDESLIAAARRGNRKALELLLATLSHDDYYQAEAASEAFRHVGRRSIPPLLAILRDRQATRQARVLAAEALNSLGSREGTAAQLELLQDPTEEIEVRRVLAHYVSSIGDERALEPLTRIALDDGADRQMRLGAIAGLGRLLDPRGAVPLLRLVQHSDPGLRRTADRALDRLGGPQAAENLGPPPRRFRNPVPALHPPAGSTYRDRACGGNHFVLTNEAVIASPLDLAAVAHHYRTQMTAAHWRHRETRAAGGEIVIEWRRRTKWFPTATAWLTVRRDDQHEGLYRLEFTCRWQPAHWFPLDWVECPFDADKEPTSTRTSSGSGPL